MKIYIRSKSTGECFFFMQTMSKRWFRVSYRESPGGIHKIMQADRKNLSIPYPRLIHTFAETHTGF